MNAERLLRLYPRAWRERYGDEFLEFVGPGRLRPQQVIDIVSGAIDAHLSREVRRSTALNGEGALMLTSLKAACAQTGPRITSRDGMIGAAVMIAGTLLIVAVATLAKRQGWDDASEVMLSLAFPGSLLFAMPFLWLKGHSTKVQALLVGVPMLILVAIGYVAVRL
jgi:hypothetical protein